MVPRLHVVRLESSSAHTKAALEIATLIRRRRLAPGARLGFHQAAAIGIPLSRDNAFLCQTDERFAVLALFVAHMVRTPPDDLWFPSHDELRAARFTPGAPPSAVIALDGGQLRGLRDITPVLQEAPDSESDSACDGVVRRAGATAGYEPESLSVAHDGSADMKSLLPRTVLDAVSPVEERLAEAARTILAAAPDLGERGLAAADQLESMRAKGQSAALNGRLLWTDHAAFYPLLRPAPIGARYRKSRRTRGLRTVPSGGDRHGPALGARRQGPRLVRAWYQGGLAPGRALWPCSGAHRC
jgi:hypothetical protein